MSLRGKKVGITKLTTTALVAAMVTSTMLTGCKLPWQKDDSSEKKQVENTTGNDAADKEDDSAVTCLTYQVNYETLEPKLDTNPEITAARIKYPVVRLGDYDGNTFVGIDGYEKLTKAISDYNDKMAADAKESQQILLEYANGDAEQEESDSDSMTDRYCDEITPDISRADSVAFSMVVNDYFDANGAHPSTTYTGVNFDASTGEDIKLKDIVLNKKGFVSAVKEQLPIQNPDGFGEDAMDYLFVDDLEEYIAQQLDSDELTWVLSDDGVEVIFNTYEIASYANGSAFIDLSFEEYGSLFSSDYQPIPQEYVKQLYTYTSYEIGKHQLQMRYEDGEPTSLNFYMDEEDVSEADPVLTLETQDTSKDKFYWFHKHDADYLYVDQTLENDEHKLTILNISDGDVEKIENENPDIAVYDYTPNNPENFLLGKKGHLMGEYQMFRHASLGDSGLPEFSGEYYMIDASDLRMTVKEDFDAIKLNEDTKEEFSDSEDSSKVTLKVGTELTLYRTDGDSIVDVKDDDGNVYRLNVTKQYINGTAIEDLLVI